MMLLFAGQVGRETNQQVDRVYDVVYLLRMGCG
jgi:hypothetical protein